YGQVVVVVIAGNRQDAGAPDGGVRWDDHVHADIVAIVTASAVEYSDFEFCFRCFIALERKAGRHRGGSPENGTLFGQWNYQSVGLGGMKLHERASLRHVRCGRDGDREGLPGDERVGIYVDGLNCRFCPGGCPETETQCERSG